MGNQMEDSYAHLRTQNLTRIRIHVHEGKIVRNVSQCVLAGGSWQTVKAVIIMFQQH